MQWSDIPFHPPARTLRQFALGLLVFLSGLACWQLQVQGNPTVAGVLGGLALLLGCGGLVYPHGLRYVFVGWLCLVFPIGWVISQTTLVLLFYGVFTPLGLVFRLCGRDVLARRRQADYDSYWQAKPAAEDVQAYFRQS